VAALTGKSAEMKTASVAVVDVDLEVWSRLPEASGKLNRLLQPREFDPGL
jgi:hypothetical protein